MSDFKHDRFRDSAHQIRLLQIDNVGGAPSDELQTAMRCTLSTWNFGDASQVEDYIAISYTWGDFWDTCTLLVNGKPLIVRRNCWYALYQSSQHTQPGQYFWIDAICIDQTDLAERSAQVTFMGDIFHAAVKVHCCIGPAGQDSEYVFQCIADHQDDHEDESDDESWLDALLTDRDSRRLVDGFVRLSGRGWFSRTWIIQELALARSAAFICGNSYISMDLFLRACLDINYHMASQRNTLESTGVTENILWMTKMPATDRDAALRRLPLAKLMVSVNKRSQCQDPRDKIYALIALIDWEGRAAIQVDYGTTCLQLAYEVLPHMSQSCDEWDIWLSEPISMTCMVLDALAVIPEDEEVREALSVRSNNAAIIPSQQKHPIAPSLPIREYRPFYATVCSKLFRHGSQSLSSCSWQKKEWFARAPGTDTTPPLNSLSVPCRKLYNRASKLVALVPEAAEPGDFLLAIETGSDFLGVVVRRTNQTSMIYQIIGVALFRSDTLPCHRDRCHGCRCFEDIAAGDGYAAEWHFDLEDLVLLLAQLQYTQGQGYSGGRQSNEVWQGKPDQYLKIKVTRPDNPLSSYARMWSAPMPEPVPTPPPSPPRGI